MDDTAQDTGETDEFARLLAQLHAPTTEPVSPPRGAHSPAPTEVTTDAPAAPRAPELMGADELAAPPHPFPPLPIVATPLIAPPPPPWSQAAAPSVSSATPREAAPADAPVVANIAASEAAVSAEPTAAPVAAPLDFAALLASPTPHDAAPTELLGPRVDAVDEPDVAKSSVGEKIILVLAVLIPPLGLIAAIGAAIRSASRRGWVIGLLRAAIAIGAVLTVIAGIGGYIGLTVLEQQQAHDRTAAASVAFCSTIKADPTMIASPTFGWPAVGATITDSLAAMQSYEDTWTKLAQVSPAGVKPEVTKIAAAAKQIIESVTVGRTVDDGANIAVMTQTASASGVPAWYAEYCK